MDDGIPGGLQHRHKTCCKKGGRRGRRAYRVQRWHYHGDVVFRTGGLAYDNILVCNKNSIKFSYITQYKSVLLSYLVTSYSDHI